MSPPRHVTCARGLWLRIPAATPCRAASRCLRVFNYPAIPRNVTPCVDKRGGYFCRLPARRAGLMLTVEFPWPCDGSEYVASRRSVFGGLGSGRAPALRRNAISTVRFSTIVFLE